MKNQTTGMIDVSGKSATLRAATAVSVISLSKATIDRIGSGDLPKGDPLVVARVAAIQAAKSTDRVLPYCHPIPIDFVGVEFSISEDSITSTVTVKAVAKTGVEMEALTGASVAALTLYDMLKPIDDTLEITGVKLISKTGGKSHFAQSAKRPFTAAVLVISDSVSSGANTDISGKLAVQRLESEGATINRYEVVPDDSSAIRAAVLKYADQYRVDLVLTTGGTGLGRRDNTPEAIDDLIERELPGVAETIRDHGQERTPFAMLSRGRAGVRGTTVIIAVPGSPQAVSDALDTLFPGLPHAFAMLSGKAGWHDKN